jgi:ABC-type branched-subunit amino acid transport system permease subunit
MSTATPSPPTLSQVVALTYTYQRIVVVWGAFPVLTALLPFFTASSLFVLNLLTNGHGVLSLGLTAFFTLGGYHMIHRLAISKESLQSSLDKNEVRLPVVMFIVSCILARFVFGPLVTWCGLMAWIPTKMITFSGAFRFAFGMALLGLAIVARYIGPASISKYKGFNHFENFPLVRSLFSHQLLFFTRIVLLQCGARRFPWCRTLLKRLSSTC